jgi:hydrogenase nickel incorporation protein HypA/HybF
MHELAVTESVLNIALEYANRAGAKRVTDLYLVIGRLASIVDDSVQFYWDILSQDTICANSQLHFTRIPANMLCLDCGNEFPLEDELSPCPTCGSPKLKVITGEEFSLDSIEIEK